MFWNGSQHKINLHLCLVISEMKHAWIQPIMYLMETTHKKHRERVNWKGSLQTISVYVTCVTFDVLKVLLNYTNLVYLSSKL